MAPSNSALFLCVFLAACSAARPAAAPSAAPPDDSESESFDFRQESEQQPFEMVSPMRGPALSINGLRFSGERGTVEAMISAYEETDDVGVLFWPGADMLPQWLDVCARSSEDPGRPQVTVTLEGAGDLSDNVLEVDESLWFTSLPTAEYAPLTALKLTICGMDYALEPAYHERFVAHAERCRERGRSAASAHP